MKVYYLSLRFRHPTLNSNILDIEISYSFLLLADHWELAQLELLLGSKFQYIRYWN